MRENVGERAPVPCPAVALLLPVEPDKEGVRWLDSPVTGHERVWKMPKASRLDLTRWWRDTGRGCDVTLGLETWLPSGD